MGKYYRDYADFLAGLFPCKMQKLTVNAALGCPNRDGTLSRSGCIYCNNASFSPDTSGGGKLLRNRDVTTQIEEGKRFFERKYPSMHYMAYFQSYTNTHGAMPLLMRLYEEALAVDKVDALIIGTRPDCVPQILLDKLAKLPAPVIMEYGVESSHNITLEAINRCHTWEQTTDAVRRTQETGLPVGLHLIMGLPGESRAMMLETVERVAALKVDTVKFHQLQVIRNTPLEQLWRRGEHHCTLFSSEEYLKLCVDMVEIMRAISPGTAIERFTSQAPPNMLLAPCWNLKNYQFTNCLHSLLAKK